jgi:hypothetical protein
MSGWGGRVSCPERGDIAAGAAIRNGATPLEAAIVGHTAAHGSYCWLTDARQAGELMLGNGRHPHPRSVARARRNATRKGFLQVKRVFPNQRPKGASFRSSFGTTNKAVNFKALDVRDPITRGQLRKLHLRQNRQVVTADGEVIERPVGPRYSSAAREAYQPRPSAVPPEIARMAAEAMTVLDAREDVRQVQADQRMFDSLPRNGRAPPG